MGPLVGHTIIELAGIGPGPFCAMMLADMGAEVIRVDRVSSVPDPDDSAPPSDILERGRRSIGLDLKRPGGKEVLLHLVAQADGLIEGFRPGVMERLGVGPDELLAHNPRLVYGRMTGWGQEGPWAHAAGHDIDYIALNGVLGAIGRAGQAPPPPLNLIGDFGGGGMLLAFGMVCGMLEATRSGRGQVVDAAMVDGAAVLSTMVWSMANMGYWNLEKNGSNLLDGAAPFYDTYRTSDDRFMAVGALEPQFYAEFLNGLALAEAELPDQYDPSGWPRLREAFAARFAERTQAEWSDIFESTDACVVPVLTFAEAPRHPHNAARKTYVEIEGVIQPAPAPRFSRTPAPAPRTPAVAGAHTEEILAELGLGPEALDTLRREGAVK